MTERKMTGRRITRDERGFIASVVDEDGSRLIHVRRDEQGRLLGVQEYRDAASPSAPEVLERVEQVEWKVNATTRQTAEVAQLLDLRSERLRRRLDAALTPPPPPSWGEFQNRVKKLGGRLGDRRDASPLHRGVLEGLTAAEAGDLPGAVRALREVADAP